MFNRKEYYKTHPEAVEARRKYMKEFNKTHNNSEYQKQWRINNKEKLKVYRDKKYKDDIEHKLLITIRARIGKALKYNLKSKNTKKLIGCSVEQLKQHLENQFREGMNWNNHSQFGWHIDHIIPCSEFDLSKEDEQCKCFHYSNMQPLWWYENLSKHKSIQT
jgi:hypothetical protein